MTYKTQITAEPGQQSIRITRDFDAPRDLVFRCLTETELLERWLGFMGMATKYDVNDVRDGGRWRYVQSMDGDDYAFRGVFHGEQTPDQMLRTFEWEGMPGHVSLEKSTLIEADGKTTLETVTTFLDVADRDGMIEAGMAEGTEAGNALIDELLLELQGKG